MITERFLLISESKIQVICNQNLRMLTQTQLTGYSINIYVNAIFN